MTIAMFVICEDVFNPTFVWSVRDMRLTHLNAPAYGISVMLHCTIDQVLFTPYNSNHVFT